MRKLKLQMQASVDGYVTGPDNEMDWMVWNWDDELNAYVGDLTRSFDTILLGRKLAEGFVPVWTARLQKNPDDEGSRKMVHTPKIVFSRTLDASTWPHTTLAGKGDLKQVVTDLKAQPGADIIAYGGVDFAASLIEAGLIDEFFLFINPVSLGKGRSLFKDSGRINFRLTEARSFPCGVAVLRYELVR